MKKLRVGVFIGGKTIEREVSLSSGRTVCDHLDTSRYQAVPIFQLFTGQMYLLPLSFLHRGKTTDFEHRLAVQAQRVEWDDLPKLIDFMYIATHGRFAEDGTLQGMLELLNIPYLGSKVFASAVGMEKVVQKKMLAAHGICVARDIVVSAQTIKNIDEHISSVADKLAAAGVQAPFIVKPHKEGSSFGISVVDNIQNLPAALRKASTVYPGIEQAVLIEEKIEGMEFSFIALTDYKTGAWLPLPPTEVIPEAHLKMYDYEQKYMPGRAFKMTPARCTPEQTKKIEDVCLHASAILGITNITRIDGFLCKNGDVVIIDPNTLSGMAPAGFLFTQAAQRNFSHTALINHLIETELHAYGMLSALIEQEQKEALVMNTKKIRVAVLFGGPSNEREISLDSGRNIIYKLSPQKYEVIPLFMNKDNQLFAISQAMLVYNSTQEISMNVQADMRVFWHQLPTIADFVFIGLHGAPGENGVVQGALEMLGVPYNGSGVLASALCMDKYKTNQFLSLSGFDVPKSLLISSHEWLADQNEAVKKITTYFTDYFPLIVKPHDDGCSVMVAKIKKAEDIFAVVENIFSQNKAYALIEECIFGMELTVGVVGNEHVRALPPSQAVATQGILSIEEKFLPGAGENQTPAPLPADALALVQHTMEKAYTALGCKGYARIDCFYQTAEQNKTGKEGVVVLEVNTLPGMTPATCIFHQAAEIGVKPMDFVDMIVTLGLQEHAKDSRVDNSASEVKDVITAQTYSQKLIES